MFTASFRKCIFHLFLISFFVSPVLRETNVNARQNPPTPSKTNKTAAVYNEEECEQLYKAFLPDEKEKSASERRKKMIRAGRQFIEKCDVPENQEVIDYLKKQLAIIDRGPGIDEIVRRFDDSVKDAKKSTSKKLLPPVKNFSSNMTRI